ncbi:MAG: hypothetical protein ACI9JO_001357, partial [Psychrobacter okhotskensis]
MCLVISKPIVSKLVILRIIKAFDFRLCHFHHGLDHPA